MIMHIVMWKLKEENKKENINKMKKLLMELPAQIKEINHMEVGEDINTASGNYDIVLVSEFKSTEYLQKYQEHPAHKKVGEFIGAVRTERTCVDYEV